MTETDTEFVELMMEQGGWEVGSRMHRLALLALRGAAMRYRPIETAPKIARSLILRSSDETHFLAIRWPEGSEGSPFPNAICWNPWIGDFSRDAGPNAEPVLFQPTHWMPLLPPPEGERP